MYDVITVGSATVDVFAHTQFSELIRIKDPSGEKNLLAFPSGSKILIEELNFTSGGGGTNTAVALRRLGHKVAYIGKLGQGTNAQFVHHVLEKEKVDQLCAHGRGKTGYSLVLDTLEHDRTILTYKGGNDMLAFSDIPIKKVKAKWFYFSAMLKTSFTTQERLAAYAKKHHIKIAFNPSTYLATQGPKKLRNILSRTTLLVLNREEAALLSAEKENAPIEKLIKKLHSYGPQVVCITNGKQTLYVSDGKTLYSTNPPDVKVVDATGAGDAFAASLLSGLLKKESIEFGIRLGIVNSTSVLLHHGAKNILLTYPAALKAMKKLKLAIHRRPL